MLDLDDPEAATRICRAAGATGKVGAVEVLMRTPDSVKVLSRVRATFPDWIIGAGTVLSAEIAERVVHCGAQFIVTPAATPALMESLSRSLVPVIPGASTPSELLALHERGYNEIKLFPIKTLGGVTYVESIAAAFSDLHFLVSGGVTSDNALHYLAQESVWWVGGSRILDEVDGHAHPPMSADI